MNLVIPSNFVYIYLIEIKLVFLWFFEHNIGLLKIGIEFVMFFLKEYKLCMVKYLSRKSTPQQLDGDSPKAYKALSVKYSGRSPVL